MLRNHQKVYLLSFFFTSLLFCYYYPWILIALLEIVGVILLLIAVIWLIFQSLKIYRYYIGGSNDSKNVHESVNKIDTEHYRQSTYPTYPSGWYPLCYSREVKKGEILQKNALGKNYVIFRGSNNGEIGILDAYCPHLGANLSVGGKVCGDEIVCPFHLWKFSKTGQCVDIPYLNKKIPKNAKTNSYPSTEFHGMICVYYNNENNYNSVPPYTLPIQKQLLNEKEYSFVDSLDYGIIKMHIQEFSENAADWKHFAPIHGRMMFPFTQIEIPFIHKWLTIQHAPATHIGGTSTSDSMAIKENNYGPDSKYFLYFITKSHLKWNGESIPKTDGNAAITFCGPAGVCIFRFNIPAYDPDAEIILFHTHLPENEMKLRVRFHWYASNKLPRLLVWYVVGNWISQWTNDIAIWENKILLQKPCLVKGDGPIPKVRRWWRQFYPQKDKNKNKNEKIKLSSDEEKNDDMVE
eukprot:431481_1